MFKVKVIKQYTFNVVVKGYSKINSLLVSVRDNSVRISAKMLAYLKTKATINDTVQIVIDKVMLITKLNTMVGNKNEKITTSVSSKEKISDRVKHQDTYIENLIKSNEKISDKLVDALRMVSDPTIGYFRKLAEFDNLTLAELDVLTLKNMDYIEMLMADSEKGVI